VLLTSTRPPLAGLRCWLADAGARVGRLHLPPGGDQFRSRRAHRLAYVSQREGARGTLAKFTAAFPGLTIADVRSGLPWNEAFLDRTSEGLESAGMRP